MNMQISAQFIIPTVAYCRLELLRLTLQNPVQQKCNTHHCSREIVPLKIITRGCALTRAIDLNVRENIQLCKTGFSTLRGTVILL